jgi:hypothetical protein
MDWMLAFVESPAALTAWGVEGTARMLVVVREKFAAHLHSMRADARIGRLSFENSSTSCAEGEHALLKKQNHGYSPLQDIDTFVTNTVQNERLRAITKRTLTCKLWTSSPLHTFSKCSRLYTPYAEGIRAREYAAGRKMYVCAVALHVWLVVPRLKLERDNLDEDRWPGVACPLPKLYPIRRVQINGSGRMHCSCRHWEHWRIKCRCLYAVQLCYGVEEQVGDCGVRWSRAYDMFAFWSGEESRTEALVNIRSHCEVEGPDAHPHLLEALHVMYPLAFTLGTPVTTMLEAWRLVDDEGKAVLWENGKLLTSEEYATSQERTITPFLYNGSQQSTVGNLSDAAEEMHSLSQTASLSKCSMNIYKCAKPFFDRACNAAEGHVEVSKMVLNAMVELCNRAECERQGLRVGYKDKEAESYDDLVEPVQNEQPALKMVGYGYRNIQPLKQGHRKWYTGNSSLQSIDGHQK